MQSKITLKANFFNGEGDIGNIENWRRDNYPLLRADILQDWIGLLEQEYDVALEDMRKEWKDVRENKKKILQDNHGEL